MIPNLEQIKSVARDLLQITGTILVFYKVFGMTDALWEAITGAVLMVIPLIWSLKVHTQANAIEVAAAIPAVKKVELKANSEGIALGTAITSTPDAVVVVAPHV